MAYHRKRTYVIWLALAIMALALSACFGSGADKDAESNGQTGASEPPGDTGGDGFFADDADTASENTAELEAELLEEAPAGESFAASPAPMGTAAAAPEGMGGGGAGGATGGDLAAGESLAVEDAARSDSERPRQSDLNAGEIDDNADWDDYLLYRRHFLEDGYYEAHALDVTDRHAIYVSNGSGLPVLGATVEISVGQSQPVTLRTQANGQVLFFPDAYRATRGDDDFQVLVEKDGTEVEFTLNRRETHEWYVTLDDIQPTQNRVKLDVLFLIDTTGSMSDEIEQLQVNILSISNQIDALPGNPDTRYGMVLYRDVYDDYLVQSYDFTPDVEDFQRDLSRVRAGGGDDEPEALNTGLYEALHEVEWRVEDTVSLIILVADAPPHLDYDNDQQYDVSLLEAAELGIKIHPIASSGLNPQGEYIFRQLAQFTGGHFIFLTYPTGDQGEFTREDLEAGEAEYTVEALDELVVKLIADELDALYGE